MVDRSKVFDEFCTLISKMVDGKYAISVGGSIGKKASDSRSDIDFRLFYEKYIDDKEKVDEIWHEVSKRISYYKEQGVIIDGCWPRSIENINNIIETWTNGEATPPNIEWTIWGYHPLTDINNQHVIMDEHKIIEGWKKTLSKYPPLLKKKIIEVSASSLKYWRNDYHYESKAHRGDTVFLQSLTTKLIHQIIEILYALNEKYYVGDGNNIKFMKEFKIVPKDFEKRINEILYPVHGDNMLITQKENLCRLIDDTLDLVENFYK